MAKAKINHADLKRRRAELQNLRDKENDFFSNKLLLVFGSVFFGIILSIVYNMNYGIIALSTNVGNTPFSVIRWIAIIIMALSAVGFVFGIYLYFRRKKKKIDEKFKVFSSFTFMIFSLMAAACAYAVFQLPFNANIILFSLIPIFGLLTIIFYIYPFYFTSCSAFFAASAATLLYINTKGANNSKLMQVFSIIAIALSVIFIILSIWLKSRDGKILKNKKSLFTPNTSYLSMVIMLTAIIISFSLYLLIGASVIYYCIIAIASVWFLIAVYATILLMQD